MLIKQSGKSVCVGDFYGDPEGVLIDKDEKWICSYGAGMTVYFIKEPFPPWMYDSETSKWLNYGKGSCSEDVVWIKNVKQVEDFKIEVEFESGMKSNFEISDNAIKIL